MNIENYQKGIPKIKELINFCRNEKIPIFYTEAIPEPSGIRDINQACQMYT
jgi:ureidoacrylate peracid hydrolase